MTIMYVRIEDTHGTVLMQREFNQDEPMDPEQIVGLWTEEPCLAEVSYRDEVNGCYDYRVVFFADLDNPDSISASGAFVIE